MAEPVIMCKRTFQTSMYFVKRNLHIVFFCIHLGNNKLLLIMFHIFCCNLTYLSIPYISKSTFIHQLCLSMKHKTKITLDKQQNAYSSRNTLMQVIWASKSYYWMTFFH